MKDSLPIGYSWKEGQGLIQQKGERKLVNAIPCVIGRIQMEHIHTGEVEELLTIRYEYADCDKVSSELVITVKELLNKTYARKYPIDVVVEVGYEKKVADIYAYSIRKQLVAIPICNRYIDGMGWKDKKYYWGVREPDVLYNRKNQEYASAVEVAHVLGAGNDVVIALILAAVHGVIKEILCQAGVSHDFVTYIVGASGIGKSYVTREICEYLAETKVMFSLGSDRKTLQKQKQGMRDTTIVIDDFNRTTSNRVKERQLQTLSELIQGASDAGKTLIDERSIVLGDNTHIVVTAEETIKNISTLNRCYMVEMEEPIADNLRNRLRMFANESYMKLFMYSYINWIEQDYDNRIERIRADYRSNIMQVGEKVEYISRIHDTLAVQYTISKTIIDYLKYMNVDEKLLLRVNDIMRKSCYVSCKRLEDSIDRMQNKKREVKYLNTLASVFCKPFLDKIAKYFWTLLQVHFGQSCKALASLK